MSFLPAFQKKKIIFVDHIFGFGFTCSGVPFPPLPPKSYSIFRNHSDDFVETRRLALNQYLQTIVKQFPSVLMSPPFADLLKLR
jgi:hypothetical protein